ncbi:hypothetical protein [Stratiformator vulcanicus]|uniref:Uncharacterized protein n=1 Tax=Stratiformator vulcanicus TaxID=2527980 RepID=A0A517R1B5_9PLAN|nr:hypothetical protein [Stratiformator vulcanicus]QDT37678.1 hypothetical protein Pan189_20600 [Stratiformator vulcanicus]
MQITLPDDPRIAERAMAAGFANVEDYVRHLVAQDKPEGPKVPAHELPYEEWKKQFDQLTAMAKPRNATLDDSREAIYGPRIRQIMGVDEHPA